MIAQMANSTIYVLFMAEFTKLFWKQTCFYFRSNGSWPSMWYYVISKKTFYRSSWLAENFFGRRGFGHSIHAQSGVFYPHVIRSATEKLYFLFSIWLYKGSLLRSNSGLMISICYLLSHIVCTSGGSVCFPDVSSATRYFVSHYFFLQLGPSTPLESAA